MGGDHTGARSGRDREPLDCRRAHQHRGRHGAGVPRDHRAETRGRSQQFARSRRRSRISTTRDGVSKRAPARGSTSCAPVRKWRRNEARLETAQLGVRRAQEALGVLMASNGPADAAGEPVVRHPRRRRTKPGGWRCVPMCGSSSRRNARPIACGATARRTGFRPASRRSIRRRSCRRASSARRAAGGLS